MSTNLTPNSPGAPPMQPPQDPGAMVPPQMMKSLDTIMGELGRLYQQCHMLQPDSPLCDAVMSVQKAMSEIGRNVGMPAEDPAQDPAAMGPPAGGGMPPDAGGMPPEMMGGAPPEQAPPANLAEAAGMAHEDMLAAAKRRKS
jgi:hypothetical protein